MLMKLVAKFAASLAVLGLSFNVLAAELNVYASMPEKYASQVLEQFTKETGIKVNFLRLSSGEVLSRLQAEKSNPQVDVLLGGPADYLEVAKNEGLTAPYKPKGSDFIPAEFKDPQNYWTGIGIMPLAFITNNNFLKKNNLKAPTSWQDFLKPEYKEGRSNLRNCDRTPLLFRKSIRARRQYRLPEKTSQERSDVHQERCLACFACR